MKPTPQTISFVSVVSRYTSIWFEGFIFNPAQQAFRRKKKKREKRKLMSNFKVESEVIGIQNKLSYSWYDSNCLLETPS